MELFPFEFLKCKTAVSQRLLAGCQGGILLSQEEKRLGSAEIAGGQRKPDLVLTAEDYASRIEADGGAAQAVPRGGRGGRLWLQHLQYFLPQWPY